MCMYNCNRYAVVKDGWYIITNIDKESRMAFTCNTSTTLVDSDLLKEFSNNGASGLITDAVTSSARDSNNILTESSITQILSTLRSRSIPPTHVSDREREYKTKVDALLANIKAEYCFYYSRYTYALSKLFSAVNASYLTSSTDNDAALTRYRDYAKKLNQKLNDMVQIVNGISKAMLTSSREVLNSMNTLNMELSGQSAKLNEQNSIISSAEVTTKLKKQMVKYTEEKGRRTDNLLQLYSFLNVVAVGLLVYIYMAVDDA
jgi:hypothetical protein